VPVRIVEAPQKGPRDAVVVPEATLDEPIETAPEIDPPPSSSEIPAFPAQEQSLPEVPLLYERTPLQPVGLGPLPGSGNRKSGTGDGPLGDGPGLLAGPGHGVGTGGHGGPSGQQGAETPPVETPPPESEQPASGSKWGDEPPEQTLAGLPPGGVVVRADEPVFRPGDREELLRRVYSQRSYPEEALSLEIEGVVVVRFRLDRDGQARDITVVQPDEGRALLEEEAVRMVDAGSPYPVPEMRQAVEITSAVAYLVSEVSDRPKVVVVRPTGNPEVDGLALRIGEKEAASDPAPGWHVIPLSARGEALASLAGERRIVGFDGDKRLRTLFHEHMESIAPLPSRTAFLRVPIKFRILAD
jgi:TonB family protein